MHGGLAVAVVCAAFGSAAAESSTEIAWGGTLPATESNWRPGYKLTARHESDSCSARCTVGIEWSQWRSPEAQWHNEASFSRLALLGGFSPEYIRGPLRLSVRGAFGFEKVWGIATTTSFVPPSAPYRLETSQIGLTGNLGGGAAWRVGPIDVGITAALTLSLHGTHAGNDANDGFMHYNALGFDTLMSLAVRH